MDFTHDGLFYRINFEHVLDPVMTQRRIGKRKEQLKETVVHYRPRTTAVLLRLDNSDNTTLNWTEVMRATCRQYFKDKNEREEARRIALRRLTPFVNAELRPLMWTAYLERKQRQESARFTIEHRRITPSETPRLL